MYSFLQDSSSTNNINLQQGQQLKDYNTNHSDYIDFNKIMTTCTPDICTMKEGMDSANGYGNKATVDDTTKEIQELDNQFSRTLSKYTAIQKQIKDEIMKKSQNYESWKNHLGKIVKNNDNYVYVNNYGYTHKYSKDAMNQNHKSCMPIKRAHRISSNVLDKMPTGLNMVSGQACQIAGKNIRNTRTNEHAYVDIKGVKHIYSKDSWMKKQKSCNTYAIPLDDKGYVAIPSGQRMTDKDLCSKVDVDPSLFMEMHKLNEDLVRIGERMYREINKLNIRDLKIKKNVNNKKEQVNKYLHSLQKERIEMVDFEKDFDTLEAQETDSELKVDSDYLHYLAFTFVALALGGITIHTILKSE